jgi:hypothetical protein
MRLLAAKTVAKKIAPKTLLVISGLLLAFWLHTWVTYYVPAKNLIAFAITGHTIC